MAKEDTPQIPQRLYKGLNTDLSPVDQPKGTYRFALNAVSETREGNMMFLSNEEGTEQYTSLIHNGLGYIIIGSIYVDDEEHMVFGITYDEQKSFIALLTGQGELIVKIDDDDNSCLKLKIANQIQGEYRLRNGCEKTIYWVDGTNPVRTYNMSEDYLSDDPDKKYNCLKFNLIKGTQNIPTFDNIKIDIGGFLKSGTYNFAIQYIDENKNETAWLTTSQLIPICVSLPVGNYDSIMGSSNLVPSVETIQDAIFGSVPSTKRIELTLGNLDINYPFYRVAVIEATSGTGLPTRALLSEDMLINDNTFIHDGNEQKYTKIPIENILLNAPDIGTARHIEQVEDRLLLANTRGTPRPYCDYQALASKITTNYVSEYVNAYDYEDLGNAKNPKSYFEKVSYMGGEVYAFGIIYIYFDGTESQAYHIPGRPGTAFDRTPIATYTDNLRHLIPLSMTPAEYNDPLFKGKIELWQIYETADKPDKNGEGLMAFWEMSDNVYHPKVDCVTNYWGENGYDWDILNKGLEGQKIRHHKFPNRVTIPHYINSIIDDNASTTNVSINITWIGNPTWWDAIAIDGEITNYIISYRTTLTGTWTDMAQVSVTKDSEEMISYYKEIIIPVIAVEFTVKITSDVYINAKALYVNNALIAKTQGTSTFLSDFDWYIRTEQTLGAVGLLGIKFDNIELPDDAVGYRIVRAERDKFNRTVLGKGYSGLTRRNDELVTFNCLTESSSPPVFETDVPKGGNILNDSYNKYFIAPENMFENADIVPQYIKVEGAFDKKSTTTSTTDRQHGVNDEKGGWFDKDGFDWLGTFRIDKFEVATTQPTESNHTVLEMNYLNYLDRRELYNFKADPISIDTRTLYNLSMDNKIGIGKLYSQYTSGDTDASDLLSTITYTSMNVDKDIHPVLDNIKYHQCKNNIQSDTSDTNYGGDTFISHFYITNSLYQGTKTQKRIWELIVKSIIIAVAGVVAAVASVASLGIATPFAVTLVIIVVAALAISVTAETIVLVYQTFAKDYTETSMDEIIVDGITVLDKQKDDTYFGVMEHAHGMFVESDINVSLREQATAAVKGVLDVHSQTSAKQYMTDKFLIWSEIEGKYLYTMVTKPEIYQYNIDYSRENQQKVWFAFPFIYDCCSECIENFPNRIFYSEKSFIEEIFDSYGEYLPLNYITVPGEHGEITNIFAIKNALYAHTKGNLWYIPQNVQERLTGDVVSLIGTGGFFDSPPRKVYDDDIGAAGSMQKFATLKTKYGVFFVDDTDGRIYALNFSSQAGTDIDDISNKGIQKWLQYNIPFNLYDDIYTLTRHKFENITNPANPSGVGFLSAYDTRNNRILFTKSDSTILDEKKKYFKIYDDPLIRDGADVGSWDPTIADEWGYNQDDNNFYYFYKVETRRKARRITLLNKTYFHDKSWTLSYSFSTAAWTSFHSYIPNFYIYDRKNFYSSVLTAIDIPIPEMYSIYKHNIEEVYQTYHNNGIKPFIIDYVSVGNPLETGIIDEITLQTIATKADVEQRYVTFNKFVAYNSRQCSGELELVPVDKGPDIDYMSRSVINEAGKVTIRKFEKDWKINGYKDYRIDYDTPVFVDNWDSIKDEYFIDKVVNVTSINFNKDWTELERFRDKYLRIRLTFDNDYGDMKLTTNYLIEKEKSVNT